MVFVIVQVIFIGRKQNAVLFLYLIILVYHGAKFDCCLVPKNGINQKCEKSNECDEAKNLLCKDGLCQCKDASLYWNEKSVSCCMVSIHFKLKLI